MRALLQHPLSALFPSMPEEEFLALSEDIRQHGQREAVIVFDGVVLDGWHRYRACAAAGVKCVTVQHDGSDPLHFVLSRNLHRRHLTAGQRAGIVVAASEWAERGVGKSRGAPGAPVAEMAKAAEVSERTIQQAKAAHEAGLGAEVIAGSVSAKRAAEVAHMPTKARERAVAAIKNGDPIPKKPTPPAQSAKTKSSGDLQALYDTTKADLEEAREKLSDASDTIRELDARVRALEITDPTEQQKEILRLERENEALKRSRNDFQTKCNEAIQQVKSLKRALDKKGK